MPGDFLGRSSETKLVRLHLPVGKIENDWARAPNGCMKGLALKANLWFRTSLSLRLGKML